MKHLNSSSLPKHCIVLLLLFTHCLYAKDLNILFIGAQKDGKQLFRTGESSAFNTSSVKDHLENILKQDPAVKGKINVTYHDIFHSKQRFYSTNLSSWAHWPYDETTEARWKNLRCEGDVKWDYIIVTGDAFTMELMPGVYADGVGSIYEEVSKGTAQLVLLMPWSKKETPETFKHYKEVVYRTGRSIDAPVAPAGLAWEQLQRKDEEEAHPTKRGAYLAAATLYSRIFARNANTSKYRYDASIASHAHKVVTENKGKPQFKGNFEFVHPHKMKYVQKRHYTFNQTGTSTETGIRDGLIGLLKMNGVTYQSLGNPKGWKDKFAPIDFNYGRTFPPPKNYVVDPALYRRSYGFQYQLRIRDPKVYSASMSVSDLSLANMMIRSNQIDKDTRAIPMKTIWAKFHKLLPESQPERDDRGHLNLSMETAAGAYMYTLLTGRCPLWDKPSLPQRGTSRSKSHHMRRVHSNWHATKAAYETAWQMGRTQARAPGFKVLPSSAENKIVARGKQDTLTVRFMLKPNADVTVTVTISDPKAARLASSKTLTFTPDNHIEQQTVMIQGLSQKPFMVQFVTSSADSVYDGLTDQWEYNAEN